MDQFTKEEILRPASLTVEDGRYCFNILSKVFGKLVLPRKHDWQATHELAKKLLTRACRHERVVYPCSGVEEAGNISNHQGVFERLKSVDIDVYLGARGEIKAGVWAKNGISSVEL